MTPARTLGKCELCLLLYHDLSFDFELNLACVAGARKGKGEIKGNRARASFWSGMGNRF